MRKFVTPLLLAFVLFGAALDAALTFAQDETPTIAQFTTVPPIEVTEEASAPVDVDVTVNVPESDPEPVDHTDRILQVGSILAFLVAVGYFWYERRDLKAVIQQASTRLATDAGLQGDVRELFVSQEGATQDVILKAVQFGALIASWTPGDDDNRLAANLNAALRGEPLPHVPAPTVPSHQPNATAPREPQDAHG